MRLFSKNPPDSTETPPSKRDMLSAPELIKKGLIRGSTSGSITPIFTLGLDILNTQKVLGQEKISIGCCVARLYPFTAVTTVLKNSSIFLIVPPIRQELENLDFDVKTSKLYARITGGLIEGGFISPVPTIMKQKLQMDMPSKNALCNSEIRKSCYQTWHNIPNKWKLLSIASRYGMVRSVIFWPVFFGLRDQGEARVGINAAMLQGQEAALRFGIGALAGVAASVASYPSDSLMKHAIAKPQHSAKQLITAAAQKHGANIVHGFFYKGFSLAGFRVLVASGVLNVTDHVAIQAYDRFLKK